MVLFGLSKKKERKIEDELKRKQELSERQINLGNEIYWSLVDAASKNKEYNVLSDRSVCKNLEEIFIKKLEKNGESYSVIACIPDKTSFGIVSQGIRGHPIFQADINLKKESALHVFYGPYGKDLWLKEESFRNFKDMLIKEISNYKHFKTK